MRNQQTAFTLLEMLIAISLSVVVMVILAAGMHIAMREWEQNSSRLDNNIDRTLALLQIERALSGAFPHRYHNKEKNQYLIFFNGEEDKLQWVSTVSPTREGGLSAWELSATEDEKGLQIKVVPAYSDNPEERLKEAEGVPVLSGYSVEFEYFYLDEQRDIDSKWIKEWIGRKQRGLPNAVRISISASDDEVGKPLEIIATIMTYQHQYLTRLKPGTTVE